MTDLRTQELTEAYRQVIGDYAQVEPIALGMIEAQLKAQNIFLMTVQHRLKTESSFVEKLSRKADTIHSIQDVTDLLGFRIICYYSDDVDRICDGLKQIFDLDIKKSVDKRKLLAATQFGYMAVHCICSLREQNGFPAPLCACKFEIQVKTVLQHAWAEIEHDLGYKTEFGIPEELRRRFSMSAGLMELGDREFVTMRDASVTYQQHIQQMISRDETGDITINIVSLREFMRNNHRMLSLYDRVLTDCAIEVIHTDPMPLLRRLETLHIDSLADLSARIEAGQDDLITLLQTRLTPLRLDIITDCQLVRMLLDGDGE